MNEQFRNLEKQCWDHQTNHLNTDKFAMMIVRECIAQAHAVSELRGITEDMKYGADISAVLIARHFGVGRDLV